MYIYGQEEELNLVARIGVTKEVLEILRREKKKQGISMAKITCNLLIEKYGQENDD